MNRRWLGYVIGCLVAVSCIAGAWGAGAAAKADNSFELLMPLSEKFMGSEQKMIVKHAGPYQSYSSEMQFVQIGQQISQRLGLPVTSDITKETDHLLYKTASQDAANGVEETLLWIGFPDGTSELVVSAQTTQPEGFTVIQSVQQRLADSLAALHIKPQWNVMIQGNASEEYSIDASPLHDWVQKRLEAHKVEQYEDAGSTSVTYYSPKFKEHINNGKQEMNLQVAVHRSSITHQNRITIGIPAITIEY
ncbi:YwmB family TATA-box binding protein [Paenibacillus sp. 32352]|uniref:YwmB family TATA-box binding protein n=1 Tax=Paenibacillus sp. 32352 TaxID=1969111 RepID=UPI0009ADD791|nr:YwmB family TATA-box binding protein [Paenibacillus sp. 32352]